MIEKRDLEKGEALARSLGLSEDFADEIRDLGARIAEALAEAREQGRREAVEDNRT